MTKQLHVLKFLLLFCIILILSASCNNADKTVSVEPVVSADSITTNAETKVQATVTTFGGHLDTLWVDSLSFTKLPNGKTVFAFTFGGKDTLTMDGWDAKGVLGNGFDSMPDIRLFKGRPSDLLYGPGTYFGNVVMREAKQIKKLLKSEKAQYVLFAPQKLGEHIQYVVFLSKEDPTALKTLLKVIATNIIVNPSPPKEF